MEEQIATRASPEMVWEAWEKAHAKGLKGKSGSFRYEIINLVPKERFSMVWKTLFVRLIFHYAVHPTQRGSSIAYDVEVKGFFAWFVRWTLEKKLRGYLRSALKTFARQLDQNHPFK